MIYIEEALQLLPGGAAREISGRCFASACVTMAVLTVGVAATSAGRSTSSSTSPRPCAWKSVARPSLASQVENDVIERDVLVDV